MVEIVMLFAPAILGIAGGVVYALLARGRGCRQLVAPPFETHHPVKDPINMSSIKVAGVGGLGLVAMATAVALNVPMIGAAMTLGLGHSTLAGGDREDHDLHRDVIFVPAQ